MTIGMWNDPVIPDNDEQTSPTPATPLFIIGIGDGPLMNSNAMMVRKDGKISKGASHPHESSIVEIQSATAGFLPPRLTMTQRYGITTPAIGLIICNSCSGCLEIWDGTKWICQSAREEDNYPVGTIFCNGIVTKVLPVLNPATGRTWMNRNISAS
ncbi:MAG TPA: hypothetical protein PKC30_09515 [Saprospiraceae bacterium]|nr:hypothetical protein [Saprospiraceae bacterium]